MYFNQIEFGTRLKTLRKERGFTQEQLASMVNIGTVHLGNIEIGKRGLSIDLILDLSEVLDVSLDFLIKGSEYTSPQVRSMIQRAYDILGELELLTQNPA